MTISYSKSFISGDRGGANASARAILPLVFDLLRQHVRRVDLRQPVKVDARADLAISLEVAEHLPEESAETFVASLTGLARVVLFSAAIPRQGGTQHLNEQWPSYWAAKFAERGYRPIDVIRPKVWNIDTVSFWYKQNTLLYVHDDVLAAREDLRALHAATSGNPLDVVHPRLFTMRAKRSKVRQWFHPRVMAFKRFRVRLLGR
jgi:hypothetical protein